MTLLDYMKNPLTGDKLLLYAMQAINENKEKLKKFQLQQWDKGVNKNNEVIGRYTLNTEVISLGFKKAGDPYNLKDSGDFRQKTQIQGKILPKDTAILLDSLSSNTDDLFQTIIRFGNIDNPNTVFGFTKNNLSLVREIIYKSIREKIKLNHGI